MYWFQVGIGRWIYQNCPESEQCQWLGTSHSPSVKCVFFKRVFSFLYTLQNYVNAELNKTEMLMNLKDRTLSTEIEYYQEILDIKKQQQTNQKTKGSSEHYTCKQPLMIAYERSERSRDNFGKVIHQFQLETKTLERILINSYRQNASII